MYMIRQVNCRHGWHAVAAAELGAAWGDVGSVALHKSTGPTLPQAAPSSAAATLALNAVDQTEATTTLSRTLVAAVPAAQAEVCYWHSQQKVCVCVPLLPA